MDSGNGKGGQSSSPSISRSPSLKLQTNGRSRVDVKYGETEGYKLTMSPAEKARRKSHTLPVDSMATTWAKDEERLYKQMEYLEKQKHIQSSKTTTPDWENPDLKSPERPASTRRQSLQLESGRRPSPSLTGDRSAAASPRRRMSYQPSHNTEEEEISMLFNQAIGNLQKKDDPKMLLLKHAQSGGSPKGNEAAAAAASGNEVIELSDFKDPNNFKATRDRTSVDLATFKELENIITEARQQYATRRAKAEEPGSRTASRMGSRTDLVAKGRTRKRIEHLEQVLKKFQPATETKFEFDPMEMLNCSYLRLPPSKVEELEELVRQSGRDPGIHAHSDLSKIDIWQVLKEDKEALEARRDSESAARNLSSRASRGGRRVSAAPRRNPFKMEDMKTAELNKDVLRRRRMTMF